MLLQAGQPQRVVSGLLWWRRTVDARGWIFLQQRSRCRNHARGRQLLQTIAEAVDVACAAFVEARHAKTAALQ